MVTHVSSSAYVECKEQAAMAAYAYSFDVFAVAALSKTLDETPCQLPKALLVTLFSKHWATCGIPEFRQQDFNLQGQAWPESESGLSCRHSLREIAHYASVSTLSYSKRCSFASLLQGVA